MDEYVQNKIVDMIFLLIILKFNHKFTLTNGSSGYVHIT